MLPEGIIVDSGSTVHVFKRPSYFINWDRNFDPSKYTVILASGNISDQILGRGTVEIRLLNENKHSKVIRLILPANHWQYGIKSLGILTPKQSL